MPFVPRTYRVVPAHQLARISPYVEKVGTLSEARKLSRPPLHVFGASPETIDSLVRNARLPMEVPEVHEYIVKEPVLVDQGIVLTEDGFAIAESLYDQGSQETATFTFSKDEVVLHLAPVELDQSALLLKKKGQTNYGHWLVELLPRLYLHARTHRRPKVFVHDPSKGFEFLATMYRETIGLCCNEVEVIPVPSSPTRVRSVRLITGVSKLNTFFSPWVRDMAKRMMDAAGPANERSKLFVTRGTKHGRAMVNAPEVERFFQDRGFQIVEPSQLSIREQVRLFASAQEVYGIMGAAMVNTIFSSSLDTTGYLAPTYMFSIDFPNTSSNPARFYLDMETVLARDSTNILAGPAVATASLTPRDEFTVDLGSLNRWYAEQSRALDRKG